MVKLDVKVKKNSRVLWITFYKASDPSRFDKYDLEVYKLQMHLAAMHIEKIFMAVHKE